MKFYFRVVELRAVSCVYTVEAETREAAEAKAAIGNTLTERDEDNEDVTNREVITELEGP